MHRFHLPPGECQGDLVILGDRDAHHAARVLRLGPGDPIEILDGAGSRLAARIVESGRHRVAASVQGRTRVPAPPPVHLAPALIKGRAMDFLVQKATELGATALSPLETARSVVHVPAGDGPGKVAGWMETAVEASKQCGNPWLPRMDAPQSLESFLARKPAGLCLIASLGEGTALPGEVLDRHGSVPSGIVLLTGPEGDFDPGEEALARAAGAVPVTLGPLVLRAETAVVAALAVLQHELRRRAGPGPGPGA